MSMAEVKNYASMLAALQVSSHVTILTFSSSIENEFPVKILPLKFSMNPPHSFKNVHNQF